MNRQFHWYRTYWADSNRAWSGFMGLGFSHYLKTTKMVTESLITPWTNRVLHLLCSTPFFACLLCMLVWFLHHVHHMLHFYDWLYTYPMSSRAICLNCSLESKVKSRGASRFFVPERKRIRVAVQSRLLRCSLANHRHAAVF